MVKTQHSVSNTGIDKKGIKYNNTSKTDNFDENSDLSNTRASETNIAVTPQGVGGSYATENTQFNEDGSKTVKAQKTALAVKHGTLTAEQSWGKKEFDAENNEVTSHNVNLAASVGGKNGANVNVQTKNEKGQTTVAVGAAVGPRTVGINALYEHEDENGHVKHQMAADANAATKTANLKVQSLKEQRDAEGNIVAAREFNGEAHIDPKTVSLAYTNAKTEENGFTSRTFNQQASFVDYRFTARVAATHLERDADGNIVTNNATNINFTGDNKGITATTSNQRGDHVVENEAHVSIDRLSDAGISHTVKDGGKETNQQSISADSAHKTVSDVAYSAIETADKTAETIRQTKQTLTETKKDVQQLPIQLLRKIRGRGG